MRKNCLLCSLDQKSFAGPKVKPVPKLTSTGGTRRYGKFASRSLCLMICSASIQGTWLRERDVQRTVEALRIFSACSFMMQRLTIFSLHGISDNEGAQGTSEAYMVIF